MAYSCHASAPDAPAFTFASEHLRKASINPAVVQELLHAAEHVTLFVDCGSLKQTSTDASLAGALLLVWTPLRILFWHFEVPDYPYCTLVLLGCCAWSNHWNTVARAELQALAVALDPCSGRTRIVGQGGILSGLTHLHPRACTSSNAQTKLCARPPHWLHFLGNIFGRLEAVRFLTIRFQLLARSSYKPKLLVLLALALCLLSVCLGVVLLVVITFPWLFFRVCLFAETADLRNGRVEHNKKFEIEV